MGTTTKKWYASKTIWGMLIAILGFVLTQVLKVDIALPESTVLTEQDITKLVESAQSVKDGSAGTILGQVMIIAGCLLGVYGRFKSETKISL
jgi:cell division ATPase FtsA